MAAISIEIPDAYKEIYQAETLFAATERFPSDYLGYRMTISLYKTAPFVAAEGNAMYLNGSNFD